MAVAKHTTTRTSPASSHATIRALSCGEYVAVHAADAKFAAKIAGRDITCRRLPMHSGECRGTLKAVAAPKAPKGKREPSPAQKAAREAFAAAARKRHDEAVARKAPKATPKVTRVAPKAAPKAQPKAAVRKIPMGQGKAPRHGEPVTQVTSEQKRAIGLLVEAGVLTPSKALEMIAALA
jgi:hypothetical protein